MKTIKLITCLALLLFLAKTAEAQTTLGGGIAYGTEIESIGIHADGQYFFKDNLAAAPSIMYYLPKDIAAGYNFKWFEFNANANYYFNVDGGVKPYGLAGLNFAFVTVPSFNFLNGSELSGRTATKVGLNLGVGADFEVGNITPFGEIKYNLGGIDQLAIAAGVRFTLK